MATNVSFNGTTYSIPNTSGESGWQTTLSTYLQALASGAATTSIVKQTVRVATTTPISIQAATDFAVVSKLSSPGVCTVNLPAGATGRIFAIVDGTGDAATNNITIDGNGSELINGSSTFVIKSNFGGVLLGWNGTAWNILSQFVGDSPVFTNINITGTATVSTLTATAGTVAGSNIVNTASAQTLSNKTLTSPVINTPTGITKSDVGLGNVDNTSDATKNSAVATLANKTLTSPELDTPLIDDYFDINEESAPSTPASGKVRVFAKSDKKLYKKGSDGVESEIGTGGGSGGINYVLNPMFEDGNVTGWATYADAAATTPVDGTGGSPNVTFAISSSTPLRGTYSGLFTKDAANRQGQGASYAFSINRSDRSKPLSISFDFENLSGTYASGDLAVYIYDVTNSILITPSSVNIAGGAGSFIASFVTTTSTSYRLILHIATANTSAYTVGVDNFKVGPQEVLLGMAGSDWQAYTPTIGSLGSGGTATNTGFWRRVGDTLEVHFSFTKDATAGTGTGLVSIGLPAGLVGDTTKIRNANQVSAVGVAHFISGAPRVLWWQSGGADILISDNAGDYARGTAFTANSTFTGVFSMPIANWSSNVQMADRALESYSSNSSTTDADDTTSFAYGIAGSLIPTITATATSGTRTKRVRFDSPIQATDRIVIEIAESGGPWKPVESTAGYSPTTYAASLTYGITADVVAGSTTDVDVTFGRGGRITSGATYAIAGASYPRNVTDRWRVRKVSGGAAVGYPVGARNVVGDTTGTAVPAGYIGETIRSTFTQTTGSTTAGTFTAVAGGSISPTAGRWLVRVENPNFIYGGSGSGVNTRVANTRLFNVTDGTSLDESPGPCTSSSVAGSGVSSITFVLDISTTKTIRVDIGSFESNSATTITAVFGGYNNRGSITAVRVA